MNQRIGEIAERTTLRPWAERARVAVQQRLGASDIEIVGVEAAGLPAGASWDDIPDHTVDRITFLVKVPKHPGVVFRVELEFDPRWRNPTTTPTSN